MAYRVFIHPGAREDIEDLPVNLKKRILSTAKQKPGEDPRGQWAEVVPGASAWGYWRRGQARSRTSPVPGSSQGPAVGLSSLLSAPR